MDKYTKDYLFKWIFIIVMSIFIDDICRNVDPQKKFV